MRFGLETALLLVSKDFIESDYIFGIELKRAMQRHAEKSCDVVPIIVRAVNIEPADAEDLPFMKLQCLPTDLKAVTSWTNRDEAWTNVAKGLRATVSSIRARRQGPSSSPMMPRALATPVVAPNGHTSILAPRAASGVVDIALDRVVAGVVQQVDEAEIERSGRAVLAHARDQLVQDTRTLVDLPDQKRVLWVDDRPENNRHETAALAKLQIEVIAVRSTGQALLRIAVDAKSGDTFDLILTDWTRPGDGADAALALLTKLREVGHSMPVVIYHGMFDPKDRAERAALGISAGAMGAAVHPSELMRLVHQALAGISGDALVIGEPAVNEPGRYARLPGARREAQAVADRLTAAGAFDAADVCALIADDDPASAPDGQRIIGAVLARDWRIVHIAGHGEPPERITLADGSSSDGEPCGVVLSNGVYLGPREIRTMRTVPELVFVNCGYMPERDTEQLLRGADLLAYDRARFASGVAEELINLGVRCVIVVGLAIDEAPALQFVAHFYEALLRGLRFIDAVSAACQAAHALGGNTWAAYQCYGDPGWSLRQRLRTRARGMDPLPRTIGD